MTVVGLYVPSHYPPRLWERFVRQPIAWLSIWSALIGVQVALDPFVPTVLFSRSLGEIPWAVGVGVGITLIAGGTTAAVAMLRDWPTDPATGMSIEMIGQWLIVAGQIAYAMSVFMAYPWSTIAWGSAALGLGFTALLRNLALMLTLRRSRAEAKARNTGETPQVRT